MIMNLVRCSPNNRCAVRAKRASGLFDDIFDGFLTPFSMAGNPGAISGDSGLRVDIYEKKSVLFIDAELPGIAKEDISIDVKGDLLTLGGERKIDEEIAEEHHYRRERNFGTFERTFKLPFEVNSDTVKATFINGILKLEIPQPEQQRARKIVVN